MEIASFSYLQKTFNVLKLPSKETKNSLVIAVVVEKSQKQFGKRLLIFRSPIDITFLNHVDRRDVVAVGKLLRTEFVETRKHCWFHRVLKEMNDHQHEAIA